MEDLLKNLLLEDDNCDKRVETDSEKERLEDFEGYDCTWDSVNEEYCCKKNKPTPKPSTPDPKPPTPNPKPNTPPVDKKEIPDRSKDIPAYLECWAWEDNNLFDSDFSGKQSQKAKEFKTWLFTYKPEGNLSYPFRVFVTDYQAKYDNFCSPKTKDYESKNELHKAPFIREMALWEAVNPQGKRISVYDWWYESTQKNPTNESKLNNKENINEMAKQLPSENFDNAQEMFNEIRETDIYTTNADVRTKVDSFEKLYRLSNETVVTANDRKSSKACSTLISQYITIAKTRVDKAFGNPITQSNTDLYPNVAKFWYEFLETLITIKSKIFSCREKGFTTPEDAMALRNAVAVVDSPWPVQLEDEDSDYNTLQSFMDKITVESLIKRKLIEKLEDKTLKESIRKKLLLKSTSNENRVSKISENLYKIAVEFYNGDPNKFIKKLDKLTEEYKKSKMYLTEDTNDSFSVAFTRVFKGDEDSIKSKSISYFLDKLGLEGDIRTSVEEELEKIPSDEVTKMFTDDWSDIIVKAIVKNAEPDDSAPENVMGAIKKVMATQIEMSSETQKRLEKEISKILTPVRDTKKEKIQNIADDIKKKIADSSES